MEWQDEGVILNVRRHGESAAVVDIFTRHHGRHLGLVRGARTPARRALLQPGNQVQAVWRARLEEHLGNWQLDGLRLRAGHIMQDRERLALASCVFALASLMPERDPHEDIALALDFLLERLDRSEPCMEAYVRFELMVLQTLGFGLDLTRCAATGQAQDLAYVSPKTGRAVSRRAGAPYDARLLALPPFLLHEAVADDEQLLAGLRLTGFFLRCHVYEPRNLAEPQARQHLLRAIERRLEARPNADRDTTPGRIMAEGGR